MSTAVHSVVKLSLGNTDVDGDFPVDENVIAALPAGSKLLSAYSYGSSAWTVTARLQVQLPDQTLKKYFLKLATEDAGKTMVEGEFHSMTELYKAQPSFAPKPHTWGQFANPEPPTYFFLCDFIEMTNKLPEPIQFCSKLANLHRQSISPTGKFGFHIPTCHGRFAQAVEWDSNWASFFAKLLQSALEIDYQTNPGWKEFEEIAERTVKHVVPRLLGVLQSEGRVLKPCLIHGDLWEGNIGTDISTGQIYIFDSGAYYAHNEMELGMWRCERQKIKSKTYKRQYIRNFGISEPVEEFEDRNRLYCVKMNIIHSAHHAGSIVRETAYNDMCYLVDKYAPFAEGEGMPRSTVLGEVDPSIPDGFNNKPWGRGDMDGK